MCFETWAGLKMSILNQAAVEALCSATYLENYLETMENLPDDLQRIVTQLRELDIQCRSKCYKVWEKMCYFNILSINMWFLFNIRWLASKFLVLKVEALRGRPFLQSDFSPKLSIILFDVLIYKWAIW